MLPPFSPLIRNMYSYKDFVAQIRNLLIVFAMANGSRYTTSTTAFRYP